MAIIDSRLTHGLIGFAIGDALGLPVKGQSLAALAADPVATMRGYGHFDLPAGYYSDETSLMRASLASLSRGFDPADLLATYQHWYHDREYAPYTGPVFEVWPSVRAAVENGAPQVNTAADPGGLVRVLPLAYFLYQENGPDLFGNADAMQKLQAFLAVTSPDPANLIAASIYAQAALYLLSDMTIAAALPQALQRALTYFADVPEALDFQVLTQLDARRAQTMAEAAPTPRNVLGVVWFALGSTSDYREATLTAVNLGGTTDATGALTGGLAGLGYGYTKIPHRWCLTLVKYSEIVDDINEAEASGHFPTYGDD
ncbi:ADP-ribosylglycohydrolase family protein [Lacticaseibacillus yichunensis]|uniref:ADP-ribosylglycohydrolase family protein n=1 Tax=Lacticaseibacillus yichunensis TaxID=2486015 RepID=A0ABW4CNU8_9LACO|nr:ADP-ribosylglycohydrolase family protein [Lacticaseibacillus yichunensis]